MPEEDPIPEVKQSTINRPESNFILAKTEKMKELENPTANQKDDNDDDGLRQFETRSQQFSVFGTRAMR